MHDWRVLVKWVASQPDVAEVLLREHYADDWGRCKGCFLPQKGHTSWPCTLWNLASDAYFMKTGRHVA